MTAVGLAINNWVNLRPGDPWEGLAPEQPNPGFCAFLAPRWSIRAGWITFRNYGLKHGIRSVATMIQRWAPPSDHNLTQAYINNVVGWTGWPSYSTPDLTDWDKATTWMRAIVRQEVGLRGPFSDAVINDAIRDAFVEFGLTLPGDEAQAASHAG